MKINNNDYKRDLQQAKENPTLIEVDFFEQTISFSEYVALCKSVYGSKQVTIIDTKREQRDTDEPQKNMHSIYERYVSDQSPLVENNRWIESILEKSKKGAFLILVKDTESVDIQTISDIGFLLHLVDYFPQHHIVLPITVVYAYHCTEQKKEAKVKKPHFGEVKRGGIRDLEEAPSMKPPLEEREESTDITDILESMETSASKSSIAEQTKDFSSDKTRLYPVYYGTNRKPSDSGYTDERDETNHYGLCRVTIPKSHKFGSIGSAWWKRWITFHDDRLKVQSVDPLEESKFWSEIKEKIADTDALIFLHGYNNSFKEAAIRAAQIGFDLKVPLTAFFSWSSKGTVEGYAADAAMIEDSEEQIIEFLTKFALTAGPKKVHIIAHSMGNRGLLRAFDAIFNKSAKLSGFKFGQIILAAPDISTGLFKNLAEVYTTHSMRTTLYVSKKDLALGASEWLYDTDRVGLLPPVTVVDKVDTVEVTNVDLTLLGHSYIGDEEALLYDMKELINSNTSPEKRIRLEKVANYWKFNS